jgi:DNA-binding response OmpR family regulator
MSSVGSRHGARPACRRPRAALLHDAGGAVVPRRQAMAALGLPDGRAIDVLVCRLRHRLGHEAGQRVVTVRGRGFRLLV